MFTCGKLFTRLGHSRSVLAKQAIDILELIETMIYYYCLKIKEDLCVNSQIQGNPHLIFLDLMFNLNDPESVI